MKSSENFALAKYTFHFEMLKSFNTNCRVNMLLLTVPDFKQGQKLSIRM